LVAAKSPPSVYEIAALLDGEPGALGRVVVLTAQRAVLIGTGLYFAGIRDKQLALGALYGSVAVTLWIAAGFALEGREEGDS
tara:strand:+ start:1170 stop:1415 length:246 start_codon:yes stop_codon:yes gene_type:complete